MSVIVHLYLRLHRQQQKEMVQCSLEQKRGEADQLPCDVSQYEQSLHWRERAYTSAATCTGLMLLGDMGPIEQASHQSVMGTGGKGNKD